MREVAEKLVEQISKDSNNYDSIEMLESFLKKMTKEVGWDQESLEVKLKKILEDGRP